MKNFNFLLVIIFSLFLLSSCEDEGFVDNNAVLDSQEFKEYQESFTSLLEHQKGIEIRDVMQFMREEGLYDKYDHVCDLINDPIIRANEPILNYYKAQCTRFQKSKNIKDKFGLTSDQFLSITNKSIALSSR